jgi:hypothetical protein
MLVTIQRLLQNSVAIGYFLNIDIHGHDISLYRPSEVGQIFQVDRFYTFSPSTTQKTIAIVLLPILFHL